MVVSIFGEECALRGEGTPDHLRGLAAQVDARMRAVAMATPRLSKTRVAMLTALQLADELARVQAGSAAPAAAPDPAAEPGPRVIPSPAAGPVPPRRTRRPRP